MSVPNLFHRYNLADFKLNTYWEVYFQGSGVFEIDGDTVAGFPGLKLKVKIGTRPIHISGSDELYLFGDIIPDLRPFAYCGNEEYELQVDTPYYYGNFGMGSPDLTPNECPIIQCFWLTEDDCELTDEMGCTFLL